MGVVDEATGLRRSHALHAAFAPSLNATYPSLYREMASSDDSSLQDEANGHCSPPSLPPLIAHHVPVDHALCVRFVQGVHFGTGSAH